MEYIRYLSIRGVRRRACPCGEAAIPGFTEDSRNVISSHLLWYGQQRSIYTHNAPAQAGMHFLSASVGPHGFLKLNGEDT